MELKQSEIAEFIQQYPVWSVHGSELVGNWKYADFDQLKMVVSQLCNLADQLDHHPTVTYGYNTLEVRTTTHDDGHIITKKDIELAQRVSQLVGE